HGCRIGLGKITRRVSPRGNSLSEPRRTHFSSFVFRSAPNRKPTTGTPRAAAASAPTPTVVHSQARCKNVRRSGPCCITCSFGVGGLARGAPAPTTPAGRPRHPPPPP